ncbi:hypothetical protein BGZ96_003713 [Linnemannia gamsii]|uniref:Uncharacterized protein n=1 Tax=Linnemannia gamsii TaxID=64522 RepID=A0ABQ7JIX7_9FUNG|nr:hypothetical protein BGZ96_003713 [Linnemannia gamsii]
MPTTNVKRRIRSFVDEAKMQSQKQNSTPSLLASKKDKTYTKKQLDEIKVLRRLRYNVLLNSAKNDDMAAVIMFPTADQFEIPLSRVSRSLEAQVELLDIYHYLKKRKENLHPSFKFTRHNFGAAMGVKLPKSTFYRIRKREDEVFSHN